MKPYLRLLKYLKPYKWKLIVAILAMIIFTLLQSVSIMTLIPLVDKVFNNKELTIPSGVSFLPFRDKVEEILAYLNSVRRYPNMLNMIVVFVMVCTVIKGIAEYLHHVMLEYVGQGVVKDLRNALYGHIQGLEAIKKSKKCTCGGGCEALLDYAILQKNRKLSTKKGQIDLVMDKRLRPIAWAEPLAAIHHARTKKDRGVLRKHNAGALWKAANAGCELATAIIRELLSSKSDKMVQSVLKIPKGSIVIADKLRPR